MPGINRIVTKTFEAPEDMEYTITLDNSKAKSKFIKRCERTIRSSMEYRDYIAYLKEYVDMNHCAFFNNVENGNGNRVRIEIHHEPFTLYDITNVVLNRFLKDGIPLNELYIADEVIRLHYENMVGLIPLSKSLHQMVHFSDNIVIPFNMIYGDYRRFMDEYADYFDYDGDTSILDKFEAKAIESRKFNTQMVSKLTPSFVYLKVDGFQLPQKIPMQELAHA